MVMHWVKFLEGMLVKYKEERNKLEAGDGDGDGGTFKGGVTGEI
jgi:hypothetical protein